MPREIRRYDLVVAGGGMAGLGAAISAARAGLRVALVHDRPVLGGRAGKECRLPLWGAQRGPHNRYARETGLAEELLLENLYRNPLGSAELWDAVLLDAVHRQDNLDLYLETTVAALQTSGRLVRAALAIGASREWTFEAPLFADCTGTAALARLGGAEVQPVAGSAAPLALLFSLKNADRPAPFVAPDWALRPSDAEFRELRQAAEERGFWRVEHLPAAVEAPGTARLALLARVYGVLDRLKNDPRLASANAHLTLDWVATVPEPGPVAGAVGDQVLTEAELAQQAALPDAVAAGGAPGLTPLPGTYDLSFRSLYSKDVDNLLLAGGSAGVTEAAALSTRAPLTALQMGEAVGWAAFHCRLRSCAPRQLAEEAGLHELQQDLLRADHWLRGLANEDPADLARIARITESSSADAALETCRGTLLLDVPRALMLPLAGKLEHISLLLASDEAAVVRYALHGPHLHGHYLPGALLHQGEIGVLGGELEWCDLPTPLSDAEPGFYWLLLEPSAGVSIGVTDEKLVGVLSFRNGINSGDSGWSRCAENLCFRTDSWIPAFYGGEQVANRFARPHLTPNIWSSAPTDFALPEWLEFTWDVPVEVGSLHLAFNTDLDLELQNLWKEYAFRAIPECVRDYCLYARVNGDWKQLVEVRGNYHRHRVHHFPVVRTDRLRLEVTATHRHNRAEIYEVRLYPPEA